MPKRIACASCNTLVWSGTGSLPEGQATCRACRAHRRSEPPRRGSRTCPTCDTTFTPNGTRKYCTEKCKRAARRHDTGTCADCGTRCDSKSPRCFLCAMHRLGRPMACELPSEHPARWFGAHSTWVPPRMIDCAWCGDTARARTATSRYCSRTCSHAAASKLRRARSRGAQGNYSRADLHILWMLFDEACAYCAEPTPFTLIHAEHVTPLARGGSNSITNLLPSCAPCNSDKRDLLLNEWNPDRNRRSLPPVRTTWDSTDPRYAHLTLAA